MVVLYSWLLAAACTGSMLANTLAEETVAFEEHLDSCGTSMSKPSHSVNTWGKSKPLQNQPPWPGGTYWHNDWLALGTWLAVGAVLAFMAVAATNMSQLIAAALSRVCAF